LARIGADGDDHYERNDLVRAAECYIIASRVPLVLRPGELPPILHPKTWPWLADSFKPDYKNPIPNLVKAGALIAAEIDRLQRAEASK
jgi:hypothetical protein